MKVIIMKIGINTMSLTKEFNADFSGIASYLQSIGCSYLEPMSDFEAKEETLNFYASLSGGRSGWDSAGMRTRIAQLREMGIDVQGVFLFDECLEEQMDEVGALCQELGITYGVLSFMNYGETLASVDGRIALVKRIGPRLHSYGVQLMVHTHDHDFARLTDHDGVEKPLIQMFLEQTTKEEMQLELDTGWAHYAGLDVAAYVHDNADRIGILHLKDLNKNYKNMAHDDVSLACGTGVVDFPAILAAVPEAQRETMRYVLDQDPSDTDILADHAASIRYLNGLVK